MIGFKSPPIKLILSVFLVSICLILLLYADSVLNKPLPEEDVTISKTIDDPIMLIKNKSIHKVKTGDSLSVIFEEKKVPLNTAYKIFNSDTSNVLSTINTEDIMEFNYIGEKLTSIEIKKNKTNSIMIMIDDDISISKIKKEIQTIQSYGSGSISSSFYKDALNEGIPDSIIMDFAFIFGWDVDFIFDVRKGDSFKVIYETKYSQGEKISSGDIIYAEFINQNNR